MKRIISILTLLFIINACDDGNVTVDAIDFSEGNVLKCSLKDVLYKVKDNQMFFIEIPSSNFTTEPTLTDAPLEVPITGTVKVVYRKFSSTVTADNLCPTVPNGIPNQIEEWNATSGIIQITVTPIYTVTNAVTNQTKITGYKYYIALKNTTFLKPDGSTQLYGDGNGMFVFGNYTVPATPPALGFDELVDKSSCDSRIFNFGTSEAMILDVGANFPTLFANEVTTTPRTALLSDINKLSYKQYANTVTDANFCPTLTTTPAIVNDWSGVAGVDGVSGTIEVSTTTLASQFQHTIHFKKVTLKKGNNTFYLGDDYIYGSFVTNP
jgi:hypothetical protein